MMEMKRKNKFYMLVGLPGSGKSSVAMKMMEEAEEDMKLVWISSDCIRKELFGSESVQEESYKVFDLMRIRTLEALKAGKDVIYDACDISSKHRRAFLQNLKKYDCEKICIVVATPYVMCLERNAARSRVVPAEVVERMYKTWTTPAFFEGWDAMEINFADGTRSVFGNPYEFVMRYQNYDQMNPFHEETLETHMVNTRKNISARGYAPDSNLALAALLHDCGKTFTMEVRKTADGMKAAHYYQHNCTGAYDALFFSYDGKTVKDILEISLMINLHMAPFSWKSGGGSNDRLRNLWGQELYNAILLIHDSDLEASVSKTEESGRYKNDSDILTEFVK